MQTEGRGEVLSNPRVVTSNQKEAVIEQGTEIPFQEASSSGATSTSFKKAVLSLRVTPQITPDDRILMDLRSTRTTVGEESSAGVPSGEHALGDHPGAGGQRRHGGARRHLRADSSARTRRRCPSSATCPGWASCSGATDVRDERRELLIFVTPKILKESLSSGG